MAENNNRSSGGGQHGAGKFFNELWKELTKPPGWMKKPPGGGGGGNKGGTGGGQAGGKKDEAGASHVKPGKRQPPSWWSWSQSDGVPAKKTKARKRKGKYGVKGAGPGKEAPSGGGADSGVPSGSKGHSSKQGYGSRPKLPLYSKDDLGSAQPMSPNSVAAQIRRHGFAPAVLKSFGLTATKVEPFGPVLRLRTNKGLVALKKTDLDGRQIEFLNGAFAHLEERDFTRFAPFLLAADGKPYAMNGGDRYYATRWIRGQEADFRSMGQLAQASRTLADFHEASRGYAPNGYAPPDLFDMVERFRDRREELVEWKSRAKLKSRPDDVDQIFLKHVDGYVRQADEALGMLREPEVRAHLVYEEEDPVLCHLDLTPYNMVYTATGQIVLIDLDFCTYGPRVLDVAHLLRRGLQRQEWEENVARHVLVNYNARRMMTRAEYSMMHGLLLFPHRFWRVAYQHYEVGHDPHHMGYFQLCEAEEESRQAFLRQFGKQVGRMHGRRG